MGKKKTVDTNLFSSAESWMDEMLYGGADHTSDAQAADEPVKKRLLILSAILLVVMLILFTRLFYMQVFQSSAYASLANGNRIRLIVDYAPRGNIYDANGVLLAENTLSFQLSATPYLLEEDLLDRKRDFQIIGEILDESPVQLERMTIKSGLDYVLPVLVADEINHEQAIQLAARDPQLKGFNLSEVPTRTYNSESAIAHVVGYTSRVNEADLEADKNGNLLPTDFIGRTGVEASYDDLLRGRNGWRRVEVDAFGRPVRVLSEQQPIVGQDVSITIDMNVQTALHDAMKQQMKKARTQRSAGVAVNPQNGSVIAMVSLPSYDNNVFTVNYEGDEYAKLVTNTNQPLFNKVISGGFTSGSIIKPLVASAALQEGVVNENTIIVDRGAISLPGGFIFRGWRPSGLGPMNVRSAIAWSSNIYFYTVGGGFGGIEGLGEERLTSYYREFGLGERSGIDIPDESPGRVPDEDWKLENKGEYWYQGDSYNISIGQGDLLISPMHITMAHTAIANNGFVLSPQLVYQDERTIRRELSVDKSNLQIVREGMRQVLTGGTTCECTFSEVPVKVAGKSGTAETNTPGGRRPHAWFTAFAPYESPEILATVLIEEGEGGSTYAAPAIAKAFEVYFDTK